MHLNKSTILGSALLALAISGAASATTINFGSQLDSDGVPMTTVGSATTVNFNNGACGFASCNGNFHIVSGAKRSHYAAPNRDTTKYLAVPNDNSRRTSATFTLGTTANYFGLLWGSIDSYNTLDFLSNGSSVASYTGTDIRSLAGTGNTFVNFFQLPNFDAVKLSSSSYAFETDNMAYALAVPAPGNLALFGLAVLGLFGAGVFRRRLPGRHSS
ncbi:MAG: PEP-CTERM sorting domain-containing protein [Salinisphaera sp.]|jgi:hypothetical protein|nr:PEP-CTERM sorting domain-containing protein [Salinisphaera sp.]